MDAKQDVLLNNQQLLVRPAAPDWHSREKKKGTTAPEAALEAPTSQDTRSAPQYYDTQKNSEQVLQEGTEAIIEVSKFDDDKQLANPNTLHEKPGFWPAEPTLPIPSTCDGKNKSEAREEDLTSHQNQFTTDGEHQPTPDQEEPDSQRDSTNFTPPTRLEDEVHKPKTSQTRTHSRTNHVVNPTVSDRQGQVAVIQHRKSSTTSNGEGFIGE